MSTMVWCRTTRLSLTIHLIERNFALKWQNEKRKENDFIWKNKWISRIIALKMKRKKVQLYTLKCVNCAWEKYSGKVNLNKNSSWLEFVYLTNDLRGQKKKLSKSLLEEARCDVSVVSSLVYWTFCGIRKGNKKFSALKIQWRSKTKCAVPFIHSNTHTAKTFISK